MSDESNAPTVPTAARILNDLPPAAQAVRAEAFATLRAGQPVTVAVLATRAGQEPAAVQDALATMAQVGLVEFGGTEVIGAHGLTTRVTRHRLTLDGVTIHTWCAVDVIGIPASLAADALAHTSCRWCDQPVEITFRQGEPITDTPAVVWLPEQPTCSNVVQEFCPEANLFCDRAHLEAWRRDAGEPAGRVLSIAETAELGRTVWGDIT